MTYYYHGAYNPPTASSRCPVPLISPEHTKKPKPKSHISRPPNAFLLFRSDLWAREKQKPNPVERDHRDISRIAAHCWRNLDAASKQKYYERAVRLREVHQTRYPEYKYTPAARKTTVRGVRVKSKRKMSEENARCARLALSIMPEVVSATKEEPVHGSTFEVGSWLLLQDDSTLRCFQVREYSKSDVESLVYQIYGCNSNELKECYAIFQSH
ncbi:high mobility group box domain-containing protein [Coprinopsis sp. MPI-PUGE-AT-0042]|nr:high mobility group box domain-containing protein [Coprinopsis sp. MPI-PUGE-AT-0042]